MLVFEPKQAARREPSFSARPFKQSTKHRDATTRFQNPRTHPIAIRHLPTMSWNLARFKNHQKLSRYKPPHKHTSPSTQAKRPTGTGPSPSFFSALEWSRWQSPCLLAGDPDPQRLSPSHDDTSAWDAQRVGRERAACPSWLSLPSSCRALSCPSSASALLHPPLRHSCPLHLAHPKSRPSSPPTTAPLSTKPHRASSAARPSKSGCSAGVRLLWQRWIWRQQNSQAFISAAIFRQGPEQPGLKERAAICLLLFNV